MSKWDNFIFEIEYKYGKLKEYLVQKFPKERRKRYKRVIDGLALYVIILLLMFIVVRVGTPQAGDTYNITYYVAGAETTVEEPELIGKDVRGVIKAECMRRGLDEDLVWAIILSDPPSSPEQYHGIMKIHKDLLPKYNSIYKDGVENSIYSNTLAGLDRLEWATANNSTIEGILMTYIYTKPVAQRLWAEGFTTTNWVESVKEKLK